MNWAKAEHPEWELAFDEVTVHSPRKVWHLGKQVLATDGVHKSGSRHHDGLAADLLLYIGGQYVSDGDHPAWRIIAAKWESLSPHAVSGRRFNDGNHVSIFEGARVGPLP